MGEPYSQVFVTVMRLQPLAVAGSDGVFVMVPAKRLVAHR